VNLIPLQKILFLEIYIKVEVCLTVPWIDGLVEGEHVGVEALQAGAHRLLLAGAVGGAAAQVGGRREARVGGAGGGPAPHLAALQAGAEAHLGAAGGRGGGRQLTVAAEAQVAHGLRAIPAPKNQLIMLR
jgi:hypothetical protein